MGQVESAVAYDGLPLGSGGAHGLGRVTARGALESWIGFLEACTQHEQIRCYFDFPQTPGISVDRSVKRLVENTFPSGRRGPGVPFERLHDAVALFESLEPQPTNQWGMAPVWLWFTTDFRLRSPGSGELWPDQDPELFGRFETPGGIHLGASSTRLILQARASIGLSLSIPEATDADLAEVVPWLQASLPMRLSAKQWTRWTLTKNGHSYQGRKIQPPAT